MQIKEFDSGKEFLLNYIPGTYDVIFLDIFLNNESGVDCAWHYGAANSAMVLLSRDSSK